MLKLPLIFVCILLSSCVIYPNRNVETPGFVISVHDEDIEGIFLASGTPIDSYRCDAAEELKKRADGKYASEPKYSWLDSIMLLPADCAITAYICGVTAEGSTREWKQNIGIFCNNAPEEIALECSTYNEVFTCAKKT